MSWPSSSSSSLDWRSSDASFHLFIDFFYSTVWNCNYQVTSFFEEKKWTNDYVSICLSIYWTQCESAFVKQYSLYGQYSLLLFCSVYSWLATNVKVHYRHLLCVSISCFLPPPPIRSCISYYPWYLQLLPLFRTVSPRLKWLPTV